MYGKRPPRAPIFSRKIVAVMVLGAVLMIGAVAAAIRFAQSRGGSETVTEIGAAQEFVKTRFPDGSTHFGPTAEISVEKQGDGTLRVNGTLDVVLAGGSRSTYSYTVIMHQSPDDGAWLSDEVSLVPL